MIEHVRKSAKRRVLASVALACGVATALSVGLAAPANAAKLGEITNWAPGYVFKSPKPGYNEVRDTIYDTAWHKCREDHPATRSVYLHSFQQHAPRGQVTSTWWCRDTR